MIRAVLPVLLLSCSLAPSTAWAQPTLADRTAGLQRQDGFVPLYWDGGAGTGADRDPGLRSRRPLLRVGGVGGRLGGTAVRSRHPRDRGDPFPALRSARAGGGPEPALSRRGRIDRSGRERPRLLCHLGAGLAAGGGGRRLAGAGGRDAALHARRRRRGGPAAPGQPGHVPPRRRPQRLPCATNQELSAEHRGRDHRHVRGRQPRAAGQQHHARRPRVHAADPSLVPAGARGLHPARRRSAHRRQHDRVPRLRPSRQRGHRSAVDHPLAAREARPGRGDERAEGADRLLSGPGDSRADANGDAGRGAVVEQGVRGGRLPQRRAGAGSDARHGSDGHPLRLDPVDQPRRARLLERRDLPRSAHRRDPRLEDADGLAPDPHDRQLLGELHADHRRRRRRCAVSRTIRRCSKRWRSRRAGRCRRRSATWCCCANRS